MDKYSLSSTCIEKNVKENDFNKFIEKYNLFLYLQKSFHSSQNNLKNIKKYPNPSSEIFKVYDVNMENNSITLNKITTNYPTNTQQNSFVRMENLCKVPPRLSGLTSLIIQLISLILITLFTTILFFHVGGYNLLFIKTNNTNIEEKNYTKSNDAIFIPEDFPTPSPLYSLVELDKELNNTESEYINSTEDQEVNKTYNL